MSFEKSFENFVQILSEEEVTPEITPSALADLSKDYSLRSIVSVVSFKPDSDKAGEPDTVIPLFGPAVQNEEPDYIFKSNMSGERTVTYFVYTHGNRRWNDSEYRNFSLIGCSLKDSPSAAMARTEKA